MNDVQNASKLVTALNASHDQCFSHCNMHLHDILDNICWFSAIKTQYAGVYQYKVTRIGTVMENNKGVISGFQIRFLIAETSIFKFHGTC